MLKSVNFACRTLLAGLIILLLLPTSSSSASSCAIGEFRAGQRNDDDMSTAVRSYIVLPQTSDVHNWGTGNATVADVYEFPAETGPQGFVQLGWYVGYGGNGLNYVNNPHVFMGEYSPGSTNDEVLTEGDGMVWGSKHGFRINRNSDGSWTYYVDNQVVGASQPHPYLDSAGFTGEVDYNHVTMWGRAADPSISSGNTEYSYIGGTWYLFTGNDRPYSRGFTSVAYPGYASDFASGQPC